MTPGSNPEKGPLVYMNCWMRGLHCSPECSNPHNQTAKMMRELLRRALAEKHHPRAAGRYIVPENLDIIAERIAERTAEKILTALFSRSRNEMTIEDICREFGISRQTVRRRIRHGLLPKPQRRRGKYRFSRSDVIKADIEGRL